MTDTNTNQWDGSMVLSAALITQLERYLAAPSDAMSSLLDHYVDMPDEERRAFAIYLLTATTDPALNRTRIDDFESAHVGTYDGWQDARNDLADSLGWPVTLATADLIDDAGGPIADLLTWDEASVRERLRQLFVIVELDDHTVSVFHREPEDQAA
jgi:hypothetical protein